jgi:hypothetical protein
LDDLASVAEAVLCHRVGVNFQGEAEGVAPQRIVAGTAAANAR